MKAVVFHHVGDIHLENFAEPKIEKNLDAIVRIPQMVQENIIDQTKILTQKVPLMNAIEAYKKFDLRKEGWINVALKP